MNLEKKSDRSEQAELRRVSDALWDKADSLAQERIALQSESDRLYRVLNSKTQVHYLDSKEEHDRYWEIKERLDQIGVEEDLVQDYLLALENNGLNEEIRSFIKPTSQDTEKPSVSKRKQKILEERARLGFDPRNDSGGVFSELDSNPRHLTTGRDRTKVGAKELEGSDALSAADTFYYYTADTHGGKSRKGKKGKSAFYRTSSGKRIRKK